MGSAEPHEPTIDRKARHAGHWRAAMICFALGVVALGVGVAVFVMLPMSNMSYLGGGLLVGGAIVFLYIGYDQRKMAHKKSEVEDLLERGEALLKESSRK